MEWADARVWAACPAALADDARLRQLLTHIHVVQRAFGLVWSNGDVTQALRQSGDFVSDDDLQAWARTGHAALRAFIDDAAPDALETLVAMPWAARLTEATGRLPGPTTLAETCLQVTSHSTYHRGQVNARLRELGMEPPLVDYIAWLWFGRPEAEWKRPSQG